MPKPLIIVESPAKARTIERLLGRRYAVKASMGHVRDLPRSQFGVDIDGGFQPKYITIRGKGDILKELREATRKASKVYLATDPDREGEAISWHLAQALDLPSNGARIEFHEITKDAVQRALKHPRSINGDLVNAQQARRILDRIVGYKLSPLLWKKVRRGLSAGRVQSVALRLVCDREDEIKAFVSEEYWSVEARLAQAREGAAAFSARFWGTADGRMVLPDEKAVVAVRQAIEGATYRVLDVKKRERRRNPAPPFTTSTMQQEASRKLGFTVKKTMAVAQQLYEGLELGDKGPTGLVTYIRTDSTRVADEARKSCRGFIAERYGADYLAAEEKDQKDRVPEGPGIQGAHEAIRPTEVIRMPEEVKPFLTPDQLKLYRLVWERFVASQMAASIYDTATAEIEAGRYRLRANGSILRFAGFSVIYTEGSDEAADQEKAEEAMLPDLEPGDRLVSQGTEAKQHFTQPPPRYTEAMLVKTLEEKGIGRPSTYAPIIETLLQRGYALKKDKRFMPSELGCLVVAMLKEYFADILDVAFTAEMEDRLDEVEEGSEDWVKVISEFYHPFEDTLKKAEEEIGPVELPEEESDVLCEKCGRRMVIKQGRFGKFLACPGFPECRFTKPLLEVLDARCPQCGGAIVERRTKKGRRFYGCSNYPSCTFVSWQRPTSQTCPECGAFTVKRKVDGADVVKCVRDTCGYEEPYTAMDEDEHQ